MLSKFCLLLIAAAGIALLILPSLQHQLPNRDEIAIYSLWLSNIKCFAIPTALFFVSFWKNFFIRACRILWGLWMAGLSLTLLWKSKELAPFVTTYGFLFITTVAIISLALMLFSVTESTKKTTKNKGPLAAAQ